MTNIEAERTKLQNAIYGVLCEYLPKYETRGYNFHTRAQTIAELVGNEFYKWVKQNRDNALLPGDE